MGNYRNHNLIILNIIFILTPILVIISLYPVVLVEFHINTSLSIFTFHWWTGGQVDIPIDRGLKNFDILTYIDILKVAYFRGVFMRDELPKNPKPF